MWQRHPTQGLRCGSTKVRRCSQPFGSTAAVNILLLEDPYFSRTRPTPRPTAFLVRRGLLSTPRSASSSLRARARSSPTARTPTPRSTWTPPPASPRSWCFVMQQAPPSNWGDLHAPDRRQPPPSPSPPLLPPPP